MKASFIHVVCVCGGINPNDVSLGALGGRCHGFSEPQGLQGVEYKNTYHLILKGPRQQASCAVAKVPLPFLIKQGADKQHCSTTSQ